MILPTTAGTAGDLVLREWGPEDAEDLRKAIAESREHLAPWMAFANEPPRSAAEHAVRFREWEQRRRSGGDGVYGMFLAGAVVGSCGLHRRIAADGLEIGYWVHVDFIRRGIARSAVTLLTDTAFGHDRISHVEIHHDVANVASGAIPRSLGFTITGESTRTPSAPGESGLERTWRMTRVEWFKVRPDAERG